MDTVSLTMQARATDAKANQLRSAGTVPCVLYGNDVENTALQCDHNELFRVYAKAGESTVVELDVAGKKVPVLIHSIDFHPVSDKIEHVDFYAVDMKKEVVTNVPLQFVGEAPAVKDLGGVLVTAIDSIQVRCLPADLPHALEIDISSLEEFGMSLQVSNIVVPNGVTVEADVDQTVASVQEPRRVVEDTSAAAAGEEGEEGEAAEGEDGGESTDSDSAE